MRLQCATQSLNEYQTDSLILFVPEFEKITDKNLKAIDTASNGALTRLCDSEEFRGKGQETAVITSPEGFKTGCIVLVGVGESRKRSAEAYRLAGGKLSSLKTVTFSKKTVFCLLKTENELFYRAAIEGFVLGSHKLLEFKSGDDAKDKTKLGSITVHVDDRRKLRKLDKAVQAGQILAEGQNLVRKLAYTPSNYLTPTKLAAEAQKLAKANKLKFSVLDEAAIKKENMGALLSVSQGSKQPPKFIIIEYNGGRKGQKPIVLVGKGVTFDSGGISLKPSANMHEMKQDMTGSALVISAIVTAARLKLPQNIVMLVPSVENMPSGTATRPGDIVTSRKGKTIEIQNTDAEGRLILADALDYANKFKPQAVVDVATLTGATIFILGYAGVPLMGNNEKFLARFKKSVDVTGEKCWTLPIWDEHREQMKSDIADLNNTGGRPAGTITAAAFLENFIGDWPWVHMDIAAVDLIHKGNAYIPKGSSGFGLRLLVEVLANWKKL